MSGPRLLRYDRLAVEIHVDRDGLGNAAAQAAAVRLREIIAERGEARVIFACAPSQDEFLQNLTDPSACGPAIDWSRVTAFHMDDYVGMRGDHPQSFRRYLKAHLLDRVPIGRFHPLRSEDPDPNSACEQYAALLSAGPIDLICLGIGENGHIAFNDPPVANFEDTALVKCVELDDACRQQQVNDGCFATIGEVPTHALTLTIPVFKKARHLSVHVPGTRKARAVHDALRGPLTTACPATILRIHPSATLYLDTESASLLLNGQTPPAVKLPRGPA